MKTLLSIVLITLTLISTNSSASIERQLILDERPPGVSYVRCRFQDGSPDWYEQVSNNTETTAAINLCIAEGGDPRTVSAAK